MGAGGIDLLIESVFNNLCGFSPTYVDFGGCINPDTDEIDLGMVHLNQVSVHVLLVIQQSGLSEA